MCWGGWLLGEETDSGVGSRREDPRLWGVKGHVEDAEVVSDHMTSEDLHRDDQWVLQQVTGGGRGREVSAVLVLRVVPHVTV